MESPAPVRIDTLPTLTVVSFNESILLDPTVVDAVETALDALLAARPAPTLLIDFSGVEALSSRLLGVLLNGQEQLQKTAGRMALCELQDRVAEIFNITRLIRVFRIYPQRAEALRDLARSRR